MDVIRFEQLSQWTPQRMTYGVVGHPVAHSLSPAMHQAGFASLGIEADYRAFEVPAEKLEIALELLEKKGVRGLNLTVPHKVIAMQWVQELTAEASQMGAVNTLVFSQGKRWGHNTDGRGFSRAIREEFKMSLRDLRIMVLGCGGAGRAVAIQSAREMAERLVLVNRTEETARALEKEIASFYHSEKLLGASARLSVVRWDPHVLARELDQIDLIVNATSVGLKPTDISPLPTELIQPSHLVFDTIYNPRVTPLIMAAREAGARTANGISMLLHQGALAFEIWFERSASLEVMRQALL